MVMSEFRPGTLKDPAVQTETHELLEGNIIVTHMPLGKTWKTYVPEKRLKNPWILFSERKERETEVILATDFD